MQKYILILIGLAAAGFILFGGQSSSSKQGTVGSPSTTGSEDGTSAVRIEGGKQIITIDTNRGYHPRHVTAKAGIPTTLSFVTRDTYDCSSGLVVPSMNLRKALEPTGKFDLPIPPKSAGDVFKATCQMGMYSLDISFN